VRDEIEELRKSLPEKLTLLAYCDIRNRSRSAAYRDLHMIPELGFKIGPHTFIDRDVMLAEMARPAVPWLPLKERQQHQAPKQRGKANGAPRRKRGPHP
jgi:hypothetical protein